MNKNLLAALAIVLPSIIIHAQSLDKANAYNRGNHHIQIGIGYPNLASIAIKGLEAVGEYTQTEPDLPGKSFPKININYDYALTNQYSIGAYVGYSSATTPGYNWDIPEIDLRPYYYYEGGSGIYQYKINSFLFGLRGLKHFNLSKSVDAYARGSVGFSINKVKTLGLEAPTEVSGVSTPTIPLPEINLGGHVGLRYYINENWGTYGELGYSTTDILQLGVSYRILKKEDNSSEK